MLEILKAIFYRPLFNLLIVLYQYLPGHDIGIAIIVLTVLIKVVLWPVSAKAIRSQKDLADIQPKVDELKKLHGNNREELAKALMALYSQHKVSPMSSCLPLLIQLPVFIALYSALRNGLTNGGFDQLYSFVHNPGMIATKFAFGIDLATPSVIFALIAGATQFFQARMTVTRPQPKGTPGGGDEQMLAVMNKQMLYVMPALTAFIGWQVPSGLTLYWITTNLLTIIQQKLLLKKKPVTEALVVKK